MTYKAAVIGCGGISRFHTRGYLANPGVQVVGASDPSDEARKRYSEEFGIETLFADAEQMLDSLKPNLVSICTPNPTHAPLATMAAKKGAKGIVCEKPMAMTLPEADAMIEACEKAGTRLIVSHQRRLEQSFMVAKALLDSGAIGKLLRMEASIGDWDLMSWGTHWLDIFRFYNDDQPTDWVFGQVQVSEPKRAFGHDVERSGFAKLKYTNGVEAVYQGGDVARGMSNRLFGTEGVIEVEPCCPEGIGGPIRLLNADSGGWRIIDIPAEDHILQPFVREMATFVECLKSGAPHPLDASSAREALAQIIGIFESSRSRQVVRFPIHIEDNPFLSMLEED
jgi:UDP-N-acetylglucosamine 3-dehydrogenase